MARVRATRDLKIEGGTRNDVAHRKGSVFDDSALVDHPEWQEHVEPAEEEKRDVKPPAKRPVKAPASGDVDAPKAGESPSAERAARKAAEQ